MYQRIAYKEFTATLRDQRFVIAGAVVLLLLLVSTETGFRHYQFLTHIS